MLAAPQLSNAEPVSNSLDAEFPEAVEVARTALASFSDAMKAEEEHGWRRHSKTDEVEVFVNTDMGKGVPMASLGRGFIAAPPEMVHSLDPSLLTVDGWSTRAFCVEHHSFKSAGPGVARRELVCVRVELRDASTGAIWMVQRSISAPAVGVSRGFVRMEALCSGFLLVPSESAKGTDVHYLTISNPCGYVPRVIVNSTMPARALAIARIRRLATSS